MTLAQPQFLNDDVAGQHGSDLFLELQGFIDERLTKGEASKHIDVLKAKSHIRICKLPRTRTTCSAGTWADKSGWEMVSHPFDLRRALRWRAFCSLPRSC
jgi:hypothetical protein